MRVVVLVGVRDFIDEFDSHLRANAYALIELLEDYGKDLSMPMAKPVGGGLWELRSRTRPSIRILYGFCGGQAVLVHAFTKQRQTLQRHDLELARKRLQAYCA